MGAFIDMTGLRFARWTVVARAEKQGRSTTWRCICDCGADQSVRGDHLRSGGTQSCGCLRREAEHRAQAGALATKHGHAATGKRSPNISRGRA